MRNFGDAVATSEHRLRGERREEVDQLVDGSAGQDHEDSAQPAGPRYGIASFSALEHRVGLSAAFAAAPTVSADKQQRIGFLTMSARRRPGGLVGSSIRPRVVAGRMRVLASRVHVMRN